MTAKVLFDTNSPNLTKNAEGILKKFIEAVKISDCINRIWIEGHTDNTGLSEYNMSLSEQRAAIVRSFMESLGIASDRLRIIAYGDARPIATNNSSEGRKKNRRVVVTLI